jgi:hypothetical protein
MQNSTCRHVTFPENGWTPEKGMPKSHLHWALGPLSTGFAHSSNHSSSRRIRQRPLAEAVLGSTESVSQGSPSVVSSVAAILAGDQRQFYLSNTSPSLPELLKTENTGWAIRFPDSPSDLVGNSFSGLGMRPA